MTGPISRNKVRLLLGARQTGKTELLRHVVPTDATRAFDLQDSDLRRRFEADPAAFAREVKALPKAIKNVVVDEIQKVPALLDEIQALHDASAQRWQIFVTGSSARRLRLGAGNLLPGRSHTYRIFPVCRWEMEEDERSAHASLIPEPARGRRAATDESPRFPSQDLARVLVHGALPGIRKEPAATAEATLATYVGVYLEEEIRREALVRDLGAFAVFLRLAAAESGQQVNVAKLSQESGVAASTLKTFYQTLVDTFTGHWLPPYLRSARKRLLRTPRFFLFDLGVRNAAAELPLDKSLLAAQGGPLLEHWVGLELIARAGYLGGKHRVSFWRTTYGVEVDFVWEGPREDIPIEVKWTERPRPEDARHLETFLREYPQRARRGVLVCRCPERQQLTSCVTAIPWREL